MNERDTGTKTGQAVVLILAAQEWISSARLSMALHAMGCRVELVSVKTHPARSTGAISKHYVYHPVRPLASLWRAIEESGATTVIATDELMVGHLEELWEQEAEGSALRELLRRSMGGPQSMAMARSRMAMARVAMAAGVATPDTVEIARADDLAGAIEQLGLPMVLKADATFGGRGVRIVNDAAEAESSWRMLRGTPSLARAIWRGVVRKEWTHVRPWSQGFVRGMSAQRFTKGTERTSMSVCHEGTVLTSVCLEVMQNWSTRGPSSVLRVVQDDAMDDTMRKVAAALGVTGFCGFDFMVEEVTGKRLLIEINPRPTQLVHLPLGPGRDLIATYLRAVANVHVADRPAVTENDTIAPFPQELQRDPKSELLRQVFHDVPWSEPGLIRRALKVVPEVLTGDERWEKSRL